MMGFQTLTAVVESTQLPDIIFTEIHALSNHINEGWYICYYCWFCSIPEGIFTVVHYRVIVIWDIKEVRSFIIIFVEVSFLT